MGITANARASQTAPLPVLATDFDGLPEGRTVLHIREVVRVTGLRREQLYMWQRRYGFPSPLRDPYGDRVYPPDQVARLLVVVEAEGEFLSRREPAGRQRIAQGVVNLAAQRRVVGSFGHHRAAA